MTLATTIWVAVLHISDATAAKISGLHDFDANEVRLAVQCVSGLRFVWHDDPDRGLRAIVETEIRGIRCLVVLYPVEDGYGDAWNLGKRLPTLRLDRQPAGDVAMLRYVPDGDFFEDDESAATIEQIFTDGEKGLTASPSPMNVGQATGVTIVANFPTKTAVSVEAPRRITVS